MKTNKSLFPLLTKYKQQELLQEKYGIRSVNFDEFKNVCISMQIMIIKLSFKIFEYYELKQ